MASTSSQSAENNAPQPEYVIERARLPLLVRIRDLILILAAWVAWVFVLWQVLGREIDVTGISDLLLARLKISADLAWAGIKFAGLILLIVLPFSVYSFFNSRSQKRVPDPVPLGAGEISAHTHLSPESVVDWRNASNLSITIGDEGVVESFNATGQAVVPLPERPPLDQ